MAPNEPMLGTPLDGLDVEEPIQQRIDSFAAAPDESKPILTTDHLAAIRARVDASSPHEWSATESGWIESDAGTLVAQAYAGSSQRRLANARFIARARQDVPALLDHIDEIGRSYQDLVERSAQEADRAQALVLRKDEEIASHDDLHRAAAKRIEELTRETRRVEACLRAAEAERDRLRKRLSDTEGERDRAVARLAAATNAPGASL